MSTKSGKVGVLAGLLALLSSGITSNNNIYKGIETNRVLQGMRRGKKGDKQATLEADKHRKVRRRLANRSRRINFAKAKTK